MESTSTKYETAAERIPLEAWTCMVQLAERYRFLSFLEEELEQARTRTEAKVLQDLMLRTHGQIRALETVLVPWVRPPRAEDRMAFRNGEGMPAQAPGTA